MTAKMISFRPDEQIEDALVEIAYYLQTQTMGVTIKRSDAIRYAIIRSVQEIRNERNKKRDVLDK